MTFLRRYVMVINNGFKFSNITGDCYVENDTLICEGKQIIRVYDFVIENRVLLDALNVNYKYNGDIVNFTQKYGPLLDWSYSVISDSDSSELDNAFENNNFEKIDRNLSGRYDINLFQNIFARLQDLVNLISAYKQKNTANMLRYCLLLLLNAPAQTVDEYHQNSTADFSDEFAISKEKMSDRPLLEAIKAFINTPDIFSVKYHDLEVPFFIELLWRTCSLCDNMSISIEDIINSKTNASDLFLMQDTDFQATLHTCTGIIIADEINFAVCDVKPYLRVLSNGDFKGDWIIPDLVSAIYMDIFLKNANSILLKKCENPTCGEYFETTIENTTKKYCSARCAQLMAKRKQREREKAKNK